MSSRHRHRESSVLPEDRPTRKAEHRRVRRNVHQALHVASTTAEVDDLVLEFPHHTHGYRDVPPDGTHAARSHPQHHEVRHWKLPFWKRRSLVRRSRAAAWNRRRGS